MIFVEARFFLFFLIVFAVHWALPRNMPRKVWLLLASQLFYAAWDWRFLSLIWISTVADYLIGRAMVGRPQGTRRVLLASSLAVNLGILGFFKYFNFFVDSAAKLIVHDFGLPTLDASAGDHPAGRDLLLYVPDPELHDRHLPQPSSSACRGPFSTTRSSSAFFPQLVAGPIVRAACEFLIPQLRQEALVSPTCASRFAVRLPSVHWLGFFKKACSSRTTSHVYRGLPLRQPERLYGDGRQRPGWPWLSYSDPDLLRLLRLLRHGDRPGAGLSSASDSLENFAAGPTSLRRSREFWRRWHISLSTWFRDYLYLPLGGNRGGPLFVARNLWAVFLLCGLWHGASWTFVVWGAYHGAFLVLERSLDPARLPRWLAHLYAPLVASCGFVIFRAPDLGTGLGFLGDMFRFTAGAGVEQAALWWSVLGGFVAVHVLLHRTELTRRVAALPHWAFFAAYGAAVALVLPWVAVGYRPFIYFQF